MDVEGIIDDIEQLQEMFEAPDIRPLSASDISAANRRHDEMLANSPWFRLWQHFGVCCRAESSAFPLGEIESLRQTRRKGDVSVHIRRNVMVLLASIFLVGNLALAQSKDENDIREADKAWLHAVERKDLDKSVSFYAGDASVLPFNAPIATGTQQVRQFWSQLMSKPGFGLSFAPSKIVVSKAHDMAYEIGTFALKLNDAQGIPTGTLGKYVVVWKKQPKDGWKAVADIFNTDK